MCSALVIIVGFGIGGGFIAGMLLGLSPGVTLSLGFGFWFISMIVPLFPPAYRYFLPVALALFGAMIYASADWQQGT